MASRHNSNNSVRFGQNSVISKEIPGSQRSLAPDVRVHSVLRLTTACVVTMLAVGTVFMNQAIFLDLAASFNLAAPEARFSFSIISLCYSLAFLFVGPVADTVDCRKIAVAGNVVISALLMSVAGVHEYTWFLACSGLMGMAAATVPASMFPYVSRLASPRRSGVYVGAIVASATLGIVVGRVALGASADMVGWRVSYRLFSLIFAVLAITSAYLLKTTVKNKNSNHNLSKLYVEMIRMLISPATASLLLTGFFLFFGFLGAITFLTYRLASPPFLFNSAEVGYISFAGLVAVIAPFSGGLSRRFGTYNIIFPSLTLCLVAMPVLYCSHSVFFTTVAVLFLFLGVYACQPLLFLLMGRRISHEAMGCASSLYILFCIGGGSISSLALGSVWQTHGWAGIILACFGSIAIALGIAIVDCRKRASIRP